MRRKVVILGAGIGGLSTAHELSKFPDDYEIIVIERNNHIGGQAAEIIKCSKSQEKSSKSTFSNHEKKHSAVCWHAISNGYKYFLDIMDEITDEDGIKVISHLRPLKKFIYADENINYIEYENSFITSGYDNFYKTFTDGFENLYKMKPPKLDMLKLYIMYIFANSICKKHLEKYDSVLWSKYISSFSSEMKRWLLDSTSIYLGMEYNKLSTHFIFDLFRKIPLDTKLDGTSVFHSFDGSMYNVLFRPWFKQLEARGVQFLFEHEVVKIHNIDKLTTLSSIDVKCLEHTEEKTITIRADIIVNAMDVKSLAKLYPIYETEDDLNNLSKSKLEFNELDIKSSQIQTQVLFYLPYRLQYQNTESTVLILHNSPWFLMVRIEGDLWSLKSSDLLSCGIGIWDKPGTNGKCAINCTREEIAIECWWQITQTKHNLKLSYKMPKWDIWDSFKYNAKTAKLDTFEPKFSNNVDTLLLRPNIYDDKYSNLYHATAYARNYTNVYNMESAAESGVKVAWLIINRNSVIKNMKLITTQVESTLSSLDEVQLTKIINLDKNEILLDEIFDIKSNDLNKKYKKKVKWYFRFLRKIDSYFY